MSDDEPNDVASDMRRVNIYLTEKTRTQIVLLKSMLGLRTIAAVIRQVIDDAATEIIDDVSNARLVRWYQEVSDRLGINPPGYDSPDVPQPAPVDLTRPE